MINVKRGGKGIDHSVAGKDIPVGFICVCTNGIGTYNHGRFFIRAGQNLIDLSTGNELGIYGAMQFQAFAPGDQIILTQE